MSVCERHVLTAVIPPPLTVIDTRIRFSFKLTWKNYEECDASFYPAASPSCFGQELHVLWLTSQLSASKRSSFMSVIFNAFGYKSSLEIHFVMAFWFCICISFSGLIQLEETCVPLSSSCRRQVSHCCGDIVVTLIKKKKYWVLMIYSFEYIFEIPLHWQLIFSLL